MAFKFKVKIPRKLEYYKESIKNARDLDKVVNAVFDLLEQTTEKDQELISVASFAGQYRKITGNEPRMEVFTEYVDTETGKYISRKKGEADALLPRELEIKKFEVEALPVAHYRQANITLTAKTAAEHFRTKKASGKLKTR